MNGLFIVFLFGLLGAKEWSILTIENNDYSLQQFYDYYPKNQWERADSSKKEAVYVDFIKRQLCIIDAKKQGFSSYPRVAVKIRARSYQLLVNESYEQLVAVPLINSEDIAEAKKFARTELLVSHILIGSSASYLSSPPERTLDDAYLLANNIKNEFIAGGDFSVLAEQYSEDPSVSRNSGSLGWVRWGLTVPAFQSAAFRLVEGVLSEPVLTSFGYHLILITDSRPSDYQYMTDEEYESSLVNLSKGLVRDQLRSAALIYDSLQVQNNYILFNENAIKKILRTFVLKQKDVSIKGSNIINTANWLALIDGVGVVCVYNGQGLGVKWFANKIKLFPKSRQPILDSQNKIVSVFKTILLQDIAIKNAYSYGVDKSYSFRERKNALVSDLLYDAYLKNLVAGAPKPDTSAVRVYYDNNKLEKYMAPETVMIREIRVKTRDLADSLLSVAVGGYDFSLLARKYSSINPDRGGLIDPFSRNNNRSFFDAAMLLGLGEISPVLQAPGGQFSIILHVEKFQGEPLLFTRVYSRIESLLIKESQDDAKKEGVEALLGRYRVQRHPELLAW